MDPAQPSRSHSTYQQPRDHRHILVRSPLGSISHSRPLSLLVFQLQTFSQLHHREAMLQTLLQLLGQAAQCDAMHAAETRPPPLPLAAGAGGEPDRIYAADGSWSLPLVAGARGGGAMEGPSPAAFSYFGYMPPPTSFAAGNWQPRPSSAQQLPRRGHPAGEGAPLRKRSPRTPTRPPQRSAQAPFRGGAERACGSEEAGYQPSRPRVRGGAERAAASNGDGYQPEWLRGALSVGQRGASSRAPSPASPRANKRLRARSRSPSRSAYNPRQAATRHQANLHDHTPSLEDEPWYDITDESLSAAEASKLAGHQLFNRSCDKWRTLARALLGLVRGGQCKYCGRHITLSPQDYREGTKAVPLALLADLLGTSKERLWAIVLQDRYRPAQDQQHGFRRFTALLPSGNRPAAVQAFYEMNTRSRMEAQRAQADGRD